MNDVQLSEAIDAYIRHLEDEARSPKMISDYRSTLKRLYPWTGDKRDVAAIGGDELAEWFRSLWGHRQPATWNRGRDVIRAAWKWWAGQGWCLESAAAGIPARQDPPARDRAIPHDVMTRLLTHRSLPIRERVLWTLLYESAARVSEVLSLDVEDCDFAKHQAKIRRKGGARDVISWRSGTARLLYRYLNGAKEGPLFVTVRKASYDVALVDVDPYGYGRLSYRQAADDFKVISRKVTGIQGLTLHMIRHTALTEASEQGANTAMLLAYSGHISVRSLARYARPSADALGKWQADRDEGARKNRAG